MKIHFIGIGGIGLSNLASLYLQQGHKIQGSDVKESEITKELREKGVKVFIGHKAKNVRKKTDKVIYSEAVSEDNVELKNAKRFGIKCQSGAQALGEFSKNYFTIAVSGMHGKGTTASMIAQILQKAGLDPTFVIGTKPGSRLGKSRYLVLEADEYKAKFLNYHPNTLVLTNVDREHLDFFKTFNNILKVFSQYLNQVKDLIIANGDDKNIDKILKSRKGKKKVKVKIKRYSLKQKEAKNIKKILKIPGIHNVSNALAALTIARALKIPDNVSFKALSEYKGSWRRFEEKDLKIEKEGARRRREGGGSGVVKLKIISDYAHHPTEIEATLKAAREKFPKRKIWCCFQPHQYQRTFYLFRDFVDVFKKAPVDKLIITDIYDVAGREDKNIKKKVSPQKLVEAIKKPYALYLPKNKIVDYLKKNIKNKEVVIIMGAGDIYKLIDQF